MIVVAIIKRNIVVRKRKKNHPGGLPLLLCSNDLKKNNKLYEPGGGMGRVELIAIECDEPAGCHSNFKSCKKKKKL